MSTTRAEQSAYSRGAGVMIAVICVLLAGCGGPQDVCTGVGTPGFALTVVDAANRRNLNAEATAMVTDLGSPRESFTTPPTEAGNYATSAGVYALKVSAPSYVTAFDTVTIAEEYVRGCPAPLVTRPIEVALLRAS